MDHNKLWEILKQMGIPDHLTHLLRNLYTSQEETVRAPKSLQMVIAAMKLKDAYSLEGKL